MAFEFAVVIKHLLTLLTPQRIIHYTSNPCNIIIISVTEAT